MTNKNQGSAKETQAFDRFIAISQEQAMENAGLLERSQIENRENMVLYSGIHPVHGPVHIVVPAFGQSFLLLPFENRRF